MQDRSQYSFASSTPQSNTEASRQRFRAQFATVLTACVRRHFSVEESFGLVFDETLDQIPLTESEQRHLYKELLQWAREAPELLQPVHKHYSSSRAGHFAKL